MDTQILKKFSGVRRPEKTFLDETLLDDFPHYVDQQRLRPNKEQAKLAQEFHVLSSDTQDYMVIRKMNFGI